MDDNVYWFRESCERDECIYLAELDRFLSHRTNGLRAAFVVEPTLKHSKVCFN